MKKAHGFKYQHCEPELKKTSSLTTEDPAKDNHQASNISFCGYVLNIDMRCGSFYTNSSIRGSLHLLQNACFVLNNQYECRSFLDGI